MADFGYFSDTDDSAVEELVSQAKELSALEQVAAINCSSFTDSTLPDDLEARFRRLKSLPASRPDSIPSSKKHLTHSKSVTCHPNPGKKTGPVCLSDDESSIFSGTKHDLDLSDLGKIDSSSSRESKILTPKIPKEKRRIVSSSSSSSIDLATPPPSDPEPEPKPKSKWLNKLSPSKLIGFIFRSPKKSSTNQKKDLKSIKSFTSGRERGIDDFDEFLSDLNAFSVEDQRKMLKKALKEQQKMRKEAAEIIKMAKQASAKIDVDDY